ncbi:MoaD/ThiS family protein [bacterium]|nr:sulfur carrier protein ThiS [Candidatus Omnitrophota bacterium]MBU2527906.1 MoaD/ThiS family protein [bacterium]MBU3929259.1 MoaD/ThiS family protein [bacterium]MBU4123838.1 MoaD/ThiS family protein [bacterium]
MVKIKVELFGPLNSPHGKKFIKEIGRNISIEEFMEKELQYQKSAIAFFVYLVNGKRVDKNTILKTGNDLQIFHPIGGG